MKSIFKIPLFLIFLILTAGQAAAWEQSFEGHTYDISQSYFPNLILTASEHGYTHAESGGTATAYFNIDKPYTGHLGFSVKCNLAPEIRIKLYDVNGSQYLYTTTVPTTTADTWHRYEYIQSPSGSGVDLYIDGVFQYSTPYSDPTAVGGYITIMYTLGTARTTFIDDISSSSAIIGCDDSADTTDGQYYRVGFMPASAVTWYAKITSPNGTSITQDLSDFSEQHIPASFITDHGTYYIRLYQHNTASGKNYFFTARPFSYSQETSGNTIILDKSEYSPGDTIKVWTYVPDFTPLSYTDNGYKIAWRVYTDAYAGEDGEETKDVLCYDLTSEEQWGTLVLPDDAPAGVGKEVRLVNPDGQDVAIATYDVLTDYNPSVDWSQDTYELNDTAKLLISQAPTGSTITFRVYSQNTLMQETTFDVSSSTGSKTINLADYTTGDKLLAILKNADGYILDQDYATVRIGDYTVSGRVYDALTGSAVPGATIQIHTESTTTDEIGSYTLVGRAGQSVVEISADGYNTYSGHVTIQDLISTRNFYIVPILDGETSGLYGIVTSWATSKPLEGALVTITKDSATYSTTTNSRGYYKIEKAGLNGTCTVKVSKTNYDTYSGYVSVSGMTLLQVKLVANTNYDEGTGGGEEDTSSPSSSSSSSSSTDRPDRESAKESLTWLEGIAPSLIKLVVVVFILALLGWRF